MSLSDDRLRPKRAQKNLVRAKSGKHPAQHLQRREFKTRCAQAHTISVEISDSTIADDRLVHRR